MMYFIPLDKINYMETLIIISNKNYLWYDGTAILGHMKKNIKEEIENLKYSIRGVVVDDKAKKARFVVFKNKPQLVKEAKKLSIKIIMIDELRMV